MRGFDGMLDRAAATAGVAAAVLAASVVRPTEAQVAAAPQQGEAKTGAKVAPAPVPARNFVTVGPVTITILGDQQAREAAEARVVEIRTREAAKFAIRKAEAAQAADRPAPIGAVQPGAVMPQVAPGGDAAIAARVQQLRPILRDELRMLTSAASPTPEQRRAIALAGGRKLKEIAKTPENNRPRVNLFGKRIIPNDPVKLVHDAVEAAAREALAPEQFARLQAEAHARFEDRREAVLMVIVAMLDRTLDFGRDQRGQILDGLRAAYDEPAFPTLTALATWGDNYLPVLPDGPIVAHLTPAQRSLWADAQKLDFRSITMMNQDEDELPGALADPDLEAALAEDPKP